MTDTTTYCGHQVSFLGREPESTRVEGFYWVDDKLKMRGPFADLSIVHNQIDAYRLEHYPQHPPHADQSGEAV